MRLPFASSVLAVSLLVPILRDVQSQQMPSAPAPKTIGMIKLSAPLPFTPQEMAEPFGFKLRLTENKAEKQTVMTNFFGSHIFTFYHDEAGRIMAVYSPLAKDDSDLCYALDVLKAEKPPIYQYLETTFQASRYCPSPSPAP